MMFDWHEYIPESVFSHITSVRVDAPETIAEEAQMRSRRQRLAADGKLCILACDHPGRRVTNALGDPLWMGDRHDYLARILRVMSHPEIDGVMTTPDIVDDLLILSRVQRMKTGSSFLDDKLIIGCMNRGGLAGAEFEMDDRMTAYTPDGIVAGCLDAAKIMFRLDLLDQRSVDTIEVCANAVTELNYFGVPVFLEPLPVVRSDTGYSVSSDPSEVIKTIGVASALGTSSARVWLKVPITPEFDRVCRATTLPMLVLGGESIGDPVRVIREVKLAMDAGSNVRGVLIGRNVLYPGNADPLGVAVAISRTVHNNASIEEATEILHACSDFGVGLFNTDPGDGTP
jgi:DhnA family fructose-bisphosphate aldolase class Ia